MISKIAIGLLVLLLSIIVGTRLVNTSLLRVSSPTGRVNVLVYTGTDAVVIALDKTAARALYFPSDVYIETAQGAGKYPVNKLTKLAELNEGGDRFIEASFERFLAVPIDIYIFTSREISPDSLSGLVKFKDTFSSKDLKTSLTRPAKFQLWWQLNRINVPKENIIDVTKTRTVSTVEQADGVEINEADARFLPVKLQQYFIEIPLAQEQFKFVVYNTSGTPGLARLASNMLENMGTDVILLENKSDNTADCTLHVSEEDAETITVARVTQVFGCEVIRDSSSPGDKVASIYLGEQFSKLMFGR